MKNNQEKDALILTSKDGLFQYRGDEEHCVVPDYVTGVDANSFYDCGNLKSLKLHDGVRHIGDFSFKLCYSLRELILPSEVDFFGVSVFQQCNKLKTIRLPRGTKRIDSGMFVCCEALKRLEIPATVDTIDEYAFGACRELSEVKIAAENFACLPESIKKIAALTYLNEWDGNTEEVFDSFVRDNSYDIAKAAIEGKCYRAIEYMKNNDMIMKRDLPKLLDDASGCGKTELTAMLIGSANNTESSDSMFEINPFA